MTVDARIAKLARRQNWVVSRRQLLELGLSAAAIAHRLATGWLHPLHRGVYLVGHAQPPPLALETAALFACAPNAVLSHRTAACLYKLMESQLMESPGPTIHITVKRRDARSRAGISIHRTRRLEPFDIRRVQRLPVTAPLRTIVDIAATEDRRTTERVLNEAQVQRMVTLPHLERRLDAERGRRGVSLLRALAVARRQPRITRSDAEKLFLVLIGRSKLPEPRTSYPIGPYEVDFAWPAQRLVAELDSIQFHSTQHKFVGDRRRWADLDALGWRLFRFAWWDITDEPEALLVRLTRSLMRPADPTAAT